MCNHCMMCDDCSIRMYLHAMATEFALCIILNQAHAHFIKICLPKNCLFACFRVCMSVHPSEQANFQDSEI